jgi:hypothetical protein
MEGFLIKALGSLIKTLVYGFFLPFLHTLASCLALYSSNQALGFPAPNSAESGY